MLSDGSHVLTLGMRSLTKDEPRDCGASQDRVSATTEAGEILLEGRRAVVTGQKTPAPRQDGSGAAGERGSGMDGFAPRLALCFW